MKTYKNAMDKIKASDSFKTRTVEMLVETKRKNKKFRFAPVAAIAASLAVVIALGAVFLPMSKDKNSFVITANAAELSQNGFTVISRLPVTNMWINEDGNNQKNYTIKAGFHTDFNTEVKGENIEKVTYSIKNGALLLTNEYSKKVVDYERASDYKGLQTHEKVACSEITTDISSQPNVDINNEIAFVLSESNDKTDNLLVWTTSLFDSFDSFDEWEQNAGTKEKEEALKKIGDIYNAILKDSELNITAEYKDGKTETKALELTAEAHIDGNESDVKDENGSWVTKEIKYITVDLKARLV